MERFSWMDKVSFSACTRKSSSNFRSDFPGFANAKDDGAQIFEDECGTCHNPKKKPLDTRQLTRAKWNEVIVEMIDKDRLDPMPSKERIEQLLDWLEANRGPKDSKPAAVQAAKP